MTTVLVERGFDSRIIRSHRASFRERLLVRCRGLALDRALAQGASPDSRPAYSIRAATLIAPRSRRRLARQVRAVIGAAGEPVRFGPSAPLRRLEIAFESQRLEAVADALDGPGPVDPRGVACVASLLQDGASPLYDARAKSTLGARLAHAMDALATET